MRKVFRSKEQLLVLTCVLLGACTSVRPNPELNEPSNSIERATFTAERESTKSQINAEPTQSSTDYQSTPAAVILTRDELPIQAQFHNWSTRQGESVLLLLGSSNLLVEDNKVEIDYLSWSGMRKPAVSLEFASTGSVQPEALTGKGTAALIRYISNQYPHKLTYILNLSAREVIGINEVCELPLRMGIGPKYISFACSENPLIWYFIRIENPYEYKALEIPSGIDTTTIFKPLWLSSDEILLEDIFHRVVCIAKPSVPEIKCAETDYWLGSISPNGKWFEIRLGPSDSADYIGTVDVDCVVNGSSSCMPRTQEIPSDMIPKDSASRFITDSVWTQDGNTLLLIVQVNLDMRTMEPERSEIWHFDINNLDLRKLYDLPGELSFGEPMFDMASAPWSPDGTSVVVNDGQGFSLLNINTGELTPLTEGGILLGEITLP